MQHDKSEDRPDDNTPPLLPREWLPDPLPPAGAAEWDVRRERILAAAEPALLRLGESERDAAWPTVLGHWWKPAAALAAAAAALLFLLGRPETLRDSDRDRFPLSVVAAEGEPFALWDGVGIDADPVLALVASQPQAWSELERPR
jgi:hypothetical protein